MADESKTIPELTPAGALDGTEQIPIWQNGATVQTNLTSISDLGEGGLKKATVVIPTDSIVNMGSSPISLVPATSGGKYVVPISILITYQYNAAPYATSTVLEVSSSGSTNHMINAGDISAGADFQLLGTFTGTSAADLISVDNPLILTTSDGVDPTGGTGSMTVYVTYVEFTETLAP